MMKTVWGTLLCLGLVACGSGGGGGSSGSGGAVAASSASSSVALVPAALFGANMAWENLADRAVTGGELLRDRSFRINASGLTNLLGKPAPVAWEPYVNGGNVIFSATGGHVLSGVSYAGHAELSRSAAGFTGVHQRLLDRVEAGQVLTLDFSSQGVGQAELIVVQLFDVYDPATPISRDTASGPATASYVTSGAGAWQRHSLNLHVTSSAELAGLALYLYHPGTGGTRRLQLDELRLSRAAPQLKASFHTAVQDLGVRALRWPGGSLVDDFDWHAAIGPLALRGEQKSGDSWQTPSFGLHEFLDFCEARGVTSVLQVNYLRGSSDAADLVEYVLGASSTPQGALRAANGRAAPWNVSIFEPGNEPSKAYATSGDLSNAALTYAAEVKPVIAAIRAKATALGKSVKLGGIIEPSFQLADWLDAVAADPNPAYDVVRMLRNWNGQALGANGVGNVDFLDGHFYGYRQYEPGWSEAQAFPYVMAGGAVLRKTLDERITPLSSAPVWITEYHIFPEENGTGVVHTDRMMDFQSGLAIGDLIEAMILQKVEGAQLFNLAQPWFGAIQNTDNGRLRPAGIVFRLYAAMAGEERVPMSLSGAGTVTLGAGSGNVPSGLSFPEVSGVATRTAAGKLRMILINRSYSTTRTVTLSVPGATTGPANIHRYENASLTANNESGVQVSVQTSSTTLAAPYSVTLAPHSIMRIDMQ